MNLEQNEVEGRPNYHSKLTSDHDARQDGASLLRICGLDYIAERAADNSEANTSDKPSSNDKRGTDAHEVHQTAGYLPQVGKDDDQFGVVVYVRPFSHQRRREERG